MGSPGSGHETVRLEPMRPRLRAVSHLAYAHHALGQAPIPVMELRRSVPAMNDWDGWRPNLRPSFRSRRSASDPMSPFSLFSPSPGNGRPRQHGTAISDADQNVIANALSTHCRAVSGCHSLPVIGDGCPQNHHRFGHTRAARLTG